MCKALCSNIVTQVALVIGCALISCQVGLVVDCACLSCHVSLHVRGRVEGI